MRKYLAIALCIPLLGCTELEYNPVWSQSEESPQPTTTVPTVCDTNPNLVIEGQESGKIPVLYSDGTEIESTICGQR